jgi:hypothetical protein
MYFEGGGQHFQQADNASSTPALDTTTFGAVPPVAAATHLRAASPTRLLSTADSHKAIPRTPVAQTLNLAEVAGSGGARASSSGGGGGGAVAAATKIVSQVRTCLHQRHLRRPEPTVCVQPLGNVVTHLHGSFVN